MNITLFGGSFNPPHLGHALVIQDFITFTNPDQLWLLPNFKSTLGKPLAQPQHRLRMCQLLIDSLPKPTQYQIKLCPIEIDLKLSGETFLAIQKLKTDTSYISKTMSIPDKKVRKIKFSFLMGSDQLPNFHKWDNWRDLLTEISFFVYPRSGHPIKPLHNSMIPFTHPNQTITNFSSTLVRNRTTSRQDFSLLLPPPIHKYILNNNLYF